MLGGRGTEGAATPPTGKRGVAAKQHYKIYDLLKTVKDFHFTAQYLYVTLVLCKKKKNGEFRRAATVTVISVDAVISIKKKKKKTRIPSVTEYLITCKMAV